MYLLSCINGICRHNDPFNDTFAQISQRKQESATWMEYEIWGNVSWKTHLRAHPPHADHDGQGELTATGAERASFYRRDGIASLFPLTPRSYIYAAWTRLSESALVQSRTLHIFVGAICFGSRCVVMRPSVACGSVETLGGKNRRAMASKWRTVFQLLVYLVYLTLMSDGREVQGEWGVYRMARAAVDREARSSCHHSNTCIARTSVSLFTAYLCNLHLAEQRITVFPLHWTLTFQILGETRTAEMYVHPAGPQ